MQATMQNWKMLFLGDVCSVVLLMARISVPEGDISTRIHPGFCDTRPALRHRKRRSPQARLLLTNPIGLGVSWPNAVIRRRSSQSLQEPNYTDRIRRRQHPWRPRTFNPTTNQPIT